jgi:hypothetical protein
MKLNSVYCGATINDASPLERLDKLLQHGQAPSSGVFRTPALQRIFDALRPMTKTFSRELLWSALSVVDGQLIGLSDFTYGRRVDPSDIYGNPLEWFCRDPDDLFVEYLRYRELVLAALMRRPDNDLQPEETRNLLDLIHLRYLVRHAPDPVLEFIAEQEIVAEYWPCRENSSASSRSFRGRDAGGLGGVGTHEHTGTRASYVLSPNFYAPPKMESPQLNSIARPIGTLDGYRPDI